MKIALATCAELPDLVPGERLLRDALARRGHDVSCPVWDDPAVAWSSFQTVVIRTTWDYFHRLDAFLDWTGRVEASGARLVNPAETVRWNSRKTYLRDLAAAGVAVVPTEWVDAPESLDAIRARRGWDEVVLKPVISGGAHRTIIVSGTDGPAQAELDLLAREGGAMVQPLRPEIRTEGEWSLVFFGGAFSHAVVKRPAAGDFRVQSEFGGTVERVEPLPDMIAEATAVLRASGHPWVYARVDGLARAGHLEVMELEIIEPELFLDQHEQAADRLADALELH